MKSYILLLLVLSVVQLTKAQVREISTDTYSRFEITVQISNDAYVTVSPFGEVLDVDMAGRYEYYSGFNNYEAGRIKQINGIDFTYYSNFNGYEAGKIKKIGNVEFVYYSNFNNYEAGKIRKIGSVEFAYYSNFSDYESGKVKAIGSTRFSYYSNFNSYEAGKIKTIGNNSFSYFSDISGVNMAGNLKSGVNNFTDNGIQYRVRSSFR